MTAAPLHRKSLQACAVVPAALLAVNAWMHSVIGPFWFSMRYDPDYVYLLNGLLLRLGEPPYHVDHPGTPVQIVIATVLAIASPLVGDVSQHVFRRPEFWLGLFGALFSVMAASAVFVFGLSAYRRTGDLRLALAAQLIPLSVPLVSGWWVYRVTAEPFLIAGGFLLAALLVDPAWIEDERPSARFDFAAGILTGLLAACKINSIPIALALFLTRPSMRSRFRFALWSASGFLFATIPIWSQHPRFTNWIHRILIHSGNYGQGPQGFIDWNRAAFGAVTILTQAPVFPLTLLAAAVALMSARRGGQDRRMSLFFVLAIVFEWAAVSKHFELRYIIPVLSLSGAAFLLLGESLLRRMPSLLRLKPWLIAMAAIYAIPFVLWFPARVKDIRQQQRDWTTAVAVRDTQLRACAKGAFYSAWDLPYVWTFGNDYARKRFTRWVEPLSENTLVYQGADGIFERFDRRVPLDSILRENGCLALLGESKREGELKAGAFPYEKAYNGHFASVYLIRRR